MAAVLAQLERVAQNHEVGLDLSVYQPEMLAEVVGALEAYLARSESAPRRGGWLPWRREATPPPRVAPLLLAGPVGTGKTTLMMLLDRALPEASCAPLFQQEIAGHPTTAENGGEPALIEVRPLALLGRTHNLPTGVVRLRELQTFYRLFTYDRRRATVDSEAAQRFARLFTGRIVYIDEFVPDSVTSFPMQVINHLADQGVQVVLSSNRRETPFVPGVRAVAVVGEDMRTGDLTLTCRPAGADPRFDAFATIEPTSFDRVARGLRGRLREAGGRRWLHLRYDELSGIPADLLAFQHLLQFTDGVLVDRVPLFDTRRGGSDDGARRFVYLVDAIYDERRPVLVRLTNDEPLPTPFDTDALGELYLPETLIDLDRAISRLRQLSALVAEPVASG